MLSQEVFDASDDELETELHRCKSRQDAQSRHLVPLILQELAERQGMADFMRQLDNMQLDEETCWLKPTQQLVHIGGGGKHAAEKSVLDEQQQEDHHVPPAEARAVPAITGPEYAQSTSEQLLLLSTAQQRSQFPDRLSEGESSVIGQCSTAAAQADACLAHADAQVGALPALPGSGSSEQQEPDSRSKAPAGEAVTEPAESSPVSVLNAAIEAYKAERRQLKKATSAQRSSSWGFCKAEKQAPKAREQAPSVRLSGQVSCQSVVRRTSSKAGRPAVADLSAVRPDACLTVAQQQPTHTSACQQDAAAVAESPQALPARCSLQSDAVILQHSDQAEAQEGTPVQAAPAGSPVLHPAEASQAAASSPLPALRTACSSSEDQQQAQECASWGERPCEPLELQQAPTHALQLATAELDSWPSTGHVKDPVEVPQPSPAAAASTSAVPQQTCGAGSCDEELASEIHASAGNFQHLGPASSHGEQFGSKVTAAALLLRDAPQAQPSADALLEEPSSGSSAEEHMTGSCSGSEAGGSTETSNSLQGGGVGAAEQAEGAAHVPDPPAAVQLMQAQAAAPSEWPKGPPLQHLSSLQLQLLQEGSSEAGDQQDPGAALIPPGALRAGTPSAAAIDRWHDWHLGVSDDVGPWTSSPEHSVMF